MTHVLYSPEAQADVYAIARYIADEADLLAADRFLDQIDETAHPISLLTAPDTFLDMRSAPSANIGGGVIPAPKLDDGFIPASAGPRLSCRHTSSGVPGPRSRLCRSTAPRPGDPPT